MEFPVSFIDSRFSDRFKSMWEPGSKEIILWAALEILYAGLEERSLRLRNKVSSFRPVAEIEASMLDKSAPMEELYIEGVNFLWNRFLLRTDLKVRDALKLLFYSANTSNAYGCSLASRAILEHVALLHYFSQKVPWRKSRRVTNDELTAFTKELVHLTLGSRIDWDKLYSGKVREMVATGEWDRPQEERLPHWVLSSIL